MKSTFTRLSSLALIVLSILNITQGQQSQLESIFNELSIVNRVINAVALQSSAINGVVKARSVIVEIFKVRPDKFGQLVQGDVEKVAKVIDGFSGKPGARFKKPPQIEPGLLQDSEAVIADIIQGINNVDNLNWLMGMNMADVVDFKRHSIDGYLPCSMDPLKALANFHKYETDPVALYKKLKRSIGGLKSCVGDLKDFDMTPLNSSLRESLSVVEGVWILKEGMKRYNATATLFSALGEVMDKVSNEFDNLKNIWSSDAANYTEVTGILADVLEAQEMVIDPTHATRGHLTSGFQKGAADIAKVVEDVQSKWFKEKISRGKDIESLVRAVTPISESAKTLRRLQDTWDKILELFSNDNSILEHVGMDLQEIEYFQQNSLDKSILTTSITALTTCNKFNLSFEGISEVDDNAFDKAYDIPRKLIIETSTIKETIALIKNTTNFPVLTGALDKLEQEIPDILNDKNVKTENERIRGLELFTLVESSFEKLVVFYQAGYRLNTLFSLIKDFNTTTPAEPFQKVQDSASSTKILEMSQCFKNSNFNHAEIERMIGFVQSVSSLFDPIHQNITATYLETLDKFQKDLKTQEQGMVALRVNLEKQVSNKVPNPVLKLNDSLGLSRQFGSAMEVLEQMVKVQKDKNALEGPISYPDDVLTKIRGNKSDSQFWQEPEKMIRPLLAGIDELERFATGARLSKKLAEIRSVFIAAEKVPGISKSQEEFKKALDRLKPSATIAQFQNAINNSAQLLQLDLDFASRKTALNSGHLALESISGYFDDIFGYKQSNNNQPQIQHVEVTVTRPYLSFLTMIGMSLGLIVIIVIVAFIAYGCTKNGRRRYKNFYLYYFPDEKEFARRRRYSLFMDRLDGKNGMMDASREINPITLLEMLKKGVCINVYNGHGNTALHMLTKKAFPEMVELLIKNGADRSLKNAYNKIPEQMIPKNLQGSTPDRIAKVKQIEEIYEKYRRKKFRTRVPLEFPVHLFHIFIESRTDNDVTDDFMERFRAITSDEPLFNTTHCIVKTNADGILETDSLDLLMWIFMGVIIVKESWMKDCLANPKLIEEDSKYLVEHVKYKGVVYKNCILPWSKAMAEGAMPYLFGVFFGVVVPGYQSILTMQHVIQTLGGTMLEEFPVKEQFNVGSHPYLHANLGPVFLIHDGTVDLDAQQNDPDKMFTLLSEEQFIVFLLKRQIHQDTRENPIPVIPDNEQN